MQPGLNSDIQVSGKTFHVQTEDWGRENPFIVTQIFSHGAVVKSYKTHYSEIIRDIFPSEHSIRRAIEKQHIKILGQLSSSSSPPKV